MLRQRRRGKFLGPTQRGNRHENLARPGHRRAEVFNFVETFYNRRRLRKHKTFGYLTPAETRQRHQHTLAA